MPPGGNSRILTLLCDVSGDPVVQVRHLAAALNKGVDAVRALLAASSLPEQSVGA